MSAYRPGPQNDLSLHPSRHQRTGFDPGQLCPPLCAENGCGNAEAFNDFTELPEPVLTEILTHKMPLPADLPQALADLLVQLYLSTQRTMSGGNELTWVGPLVDGAEAALAKPFEPRRAPDPAGCA